MVTQGYDMKQGSPRDDAIMLGTIEEGRRRNMRQLLLRASRIIEAELRERLVKEFDTTLPRFDVMAALYRTPHGMLMSDLSRFLLVSNGNVTGIVDRLVSEGLLQRGQRNGDRRTSIVQLTRTGRDAFRAMAAAHERWVGELLAGVTKNDARQLTSMLKAFRSDWEGRE